ncbi:MAG: DMT family transporter [Hyphomicrobiaceae bacterium]
MWRIWAAALFWGLNWPVIKVMLTGSGPWTLRAAGLTGGAALLAAATVASGQSLHVPRRHWANLFIAALLNVAAFNLLSVFAQMSMTASRAAILTYTMPLWSVLFARIVLHEPIDTLRGFALAFGAIGITLLAIPFWDVIQAGGIPLGLVYVMGAATTWAAGTVFIKAAAPQGAPLALTTWQFAIGAVVVTIGMALFETPHLELDRPLILGLFVYNIIFPQALAYALWFGLMARVPASTAALGTLLVPISAVVSSSLWLGERLSPLDLTGFGLILLGVLLDQGGRLWLGRSRTSSPAAPRTHRSP